MLTIDSDGGLAKVDVLRREIGRDRGLLVGRDGGLLVGRDSGLLIERDSGLLVGRGETSCCLTLPHITDRVPKLKITLVWSIPL